MEDNHMTRGPLADIRPWVHRAWIITTPRSGSTWLCHLLNAAVGLPLDVSDYFPEFLNRRIWREHVTRGVDPRYTAVSKVHAEQLQRLGLTIADRPLRMIYLNRRDEAEQAASMFCVAQRGKATATTDDVLQRLQAQPIEWDAAAAHHYLGRVRIENDYLRTHWLAEDVLTVHYEDLATDAEAQVGRIMDYLNVADFAFDDRPNMPRRIGSPPEIVENMRGLLVMHETGMYAPPTTDKDTGDGQRFGGFRTSRETGVEK